MNKLGKKKYLILITEALTSVYGDTLWEGDTDLAMAKKVLQKLTPYLYFHPHDMSTKEFNKWRKDFIKELTE